MLYIFAISIKLVNATYALSFGCSLYFYFNSLPFSLLFFFLPFSSTFSLVFIHARTQLGVALGFLLPPLIVRNHDDLELVGQDFQLMFYVIAGFTSLLVILVFFCKFFKAHPVYICRL